MYCVFLRERERERERERKKSKAMCYGIVSSERNKVKDGWGSFIS